MCVCVSVPQTLQLQFNLCCVGLLKDVFPCGASPAMELCWCSGGFKRKRVKGEGWDKGEGGKEV